MKNSRTLTETLVLTSQNKTFHPFQMDLGVYIWRACRCFLKCDYLILFSLLIFILIAQNGEAIEQGIKTVNVNVGDNATMVFPGYGAMIEHHKCDIKNYEIWAPKTKRIFASKFANGTDAKCVEDCNIYSNRGSILDDSKNVTFTLVNVTRADQSSYCLKITCSGSDDINNNCDEMRSLVIVEMKRKSSLYNKKGSKFKEKVEPTQHDQGGRSQNSKGEKINGCMLLLTISVIITVLLLM